MDREKLKKLFKFYDNHCSKCLESFDLLDGLSKYLFSNFKEHKNPITDRDILDHLRWVCNQAPIFVNEGKINKALRWLGFIQGVLFSQGHFSIKELKIQSRKEEKNFL